jgi:hypothetical protein
MTETVKLVPSAVTVVQNKPSTAFGQQAKAPIESAEAMILTRAALSPEIPATAVVSNGLLTFKQVDSVSGSVSVSVRPNVAKFDQKTTWNRKPAGTSTTVTLTKSSPVAGTLWTFDVTAHLQDFVDGDLTNFGWQVTTTFGTRFYLFGAVAASGKPSLTFTYETIPPAPQTLKPNGAAVSIAKPVLGWDPIPGVTAAQVQIDPAANPTAPAFDSGEVSVLSSSLALSGTAYAGLADGSTTSWRVRVRTPGGLSAWSAWATFSRVGKGTVTITNPGVTSGDGTPPVQATFSGTLTQWRVTLRNDAGVQLDTSGWRSDPAIEWTPLKGLTTSGQSGTFTVEAVDNVVRVATPGDPVAAIATQTFTLTLSASVPGMDSVVVEQRGVSPVVFLVGTRSEIPDEVAVFADGVQIARMPGLDVFTDTSFEIPLYNLPMGYRVSLVAKPVVNNEISDDEHAVSIVPTCTGVWLVAEDDGTALGLLGQENDVPEATDSAVVHTPATGDAAPVRRRMSRPPKSGAQSGDILDWHRRGVSGNDITADDMLAVVDLFAESDQARLYRYVVGHLNLRVIAGDFVSWPTPLSAPEERIATASFSWWGQAE